jgi:uncharacterized membrane protein YraQ (UPF0718 family)
MPVQHQGDYFLHNKEKPSFIQVLKKAASIFILMSPMLLGVIGLVGIMQVYLTPEMLSSAFGNGMFIDTVVGTFAGAISSGNPAISYVVGGELLEEGTSLYAVTAFILSWVTLGFIQLPAEAAALGFRFTLYRNLLSLIATVVIAIATVETIGFIK